MYTQGLNQAVEEGGPEDAELLARFQAKIDREEKIEPNDWMPAAYRQTLVRQISASTPIPRSSACCRRATG